MENTIVLGGAQRQIAPLKSLQVAAFYDAIDDAKEGETKVKTFTRSLRIIGLALKNGKDQLVEGLDEEQTIAKIDETAAWKEVDEAFGKVLEISGLRKSDDAAGEAPAAESISNASSAASSAS